MCPFNIQEVFKLQGHGFETIFQDKIRMGWIQLGLEQKVRTILHLSFKGTL